MKIERSSGHLYTMGQHGPYPGATAICALQDSTGGSDGLLNWAVNLALDEVQRAGPDIEWEEVRAQALEAKNRARNIGSAVHAALDRFNLGEPLNLTPDIAPYVAHYGAFAHQHHLKVVGSEKYVINTDIGFGGTYDLLGMIDGELALLDAKTGKEKASQRLQLTGLAMGQLHGAVGEEPEPLPDIEATYVLLLRPDGYQLIRHEITDDDRAHFCALVETYHRIRQWAAPPAKKESKAA